MSGELTKTDRQGDISLLELRHRYDVDMPVPFERDIFLFDTHVAGTGYVEGIEELEPFLKEGDRLNFFREPDNPFDENAIVIRTEDGAKTGYVPRADNVVFSRLMDAGKELFGRITKKSWEGKWLKIDIKIFLKD
jgi:hypothetical protein